MVLFDKLSPAQKQIIVDISRIQLSSLRRIYNNEHLTDDDLVMLFIYNDITKEDFIAELDIKIAKINNFIKDPDSIQKMDKYELSIYKHILFQIEDNYKDRYPQALSSIWERLFILTDFKIDWPMALN
ncbi:MAG: hypothetical protein CL596_05105 [Alteromonas sp.]|nr:hypothetical protein [Alteromonas sp.]|tara:strand:- start:21277 stop:21660 length:384 start_codon:yes stop_codon:yes gene_type:complete